MTSKNQKKCNTYLLMKKNKCQIAVNVTYSKAFPPDLKLEQLAINNIHLTYA